MSGKSDIPCPGGKCQSTIQLEEVKQIIKDDNLFAKHEKTRLDKMVAVSNHLVWCPTADCNTICHAETKATSTSVHCYQCQARFCSRCFQDWHAGNPCRSNASDIPNTKPCPKCQVLIQKVGGCSVMQCSYCGQKFCWSCEKTDAFCCIRFNFFGHDFIEMVLVLVVLIIETLIVIPLFSKTMETLILPNRGGVIYTFLKISTQVVICHTIFFALRSTFICHT